VRRSAQGIVKPAAVFCAGALTGGARNAGLQWDSTGAAALGARTLLLLAPLQATLGVGRFVGGRISLLFNIGYLLIEHRRGWISIWRIQNAAWRRRASLYAEGVCAARSLPICCCSAGRRRPACALRERAFSVLARA